MEVKKTKDQKKVQIIKDLKKRKGITLIALVITITILMILAGITVSKITGKEGFLIKTKSVSEETNREGIIKLARLDVFNEQINNYEGMTEESFKKILAKYFDYNPENELPKDLSELILTTKDGKYNDIKASEIYDDGFNDTN